MLRIITSTTSGQAKKYYSEGLTREGYYSEGQEMAGLWGGLAAQRLGLSGTVQKDDFVRLCDNLHPHTGEKLTPRTKDNRRVGYDLNFHAPKSVTLAYAWRRDDRILKLFRRVVQETMQDIEQEVSTRVRRGGRDENSPTRNLAWAEFVHFTARPVDGICDPHLHAHCFAFNATFDENEARWKALQFVEIKRHANEYQAMFLSRLATGLQELGYDIVRKGKSFEIAGVSRALIEKFSRRSKVVNDKAKALGITTNEAKDGLAALTREKKIKDVALSDLEPIWWTRLSPAEKMALDGLQTVLSRPPVRRELDGKAAARQAVESAINHRFERASVVSERDLTAEALQWGFGQATLAEIREAVKEAALIRVEQDGRTLLTTWQVRAEEGRIVDRCKLGFGKHAALNPAWRIQDEQLNFQQKSAVFHVLCSKDFIAGIQGRAGAGKTRLLHEIRKGIEASGQQLLILTPQAEAAHDTMPQEGFENTHTVAKLLESEYLQRFGNGGVWLVDEAGLLSCRTMDKLLQMAERQSARVVLIGDTRQHHAVDRGQAFDLLQKFGHLDVATVDEIQRQTGAYKRAVEQIADRDFVAAFDTLENMGAFREMPAFERESAVAKDYLELLKEGKSALVVSPTHTECENITGAIREARKERGEMDDGKKWNILRNLSWTEAEKAEPLLYRPGLVVKATKSLKGFEINKEMLVVGATEHGVMVLSDSKPKELPLNKSKRFTVFERDAIEVSAGERIRITANGRDKDKHRLNNGRLFAVTKIGKDGSLTLENGWVLDKSFKHLDYGYATTSHAAQGKTVDVVLVCQSGLVASGATDAKQFYVSVSRGRKEVRIYTDDIEGLRENVAHEREREMAMELTM